MTVAEATRWGEQQAHSRDTWETPPGSNVTVVWDDYHAITGQPAYQRQPWCGAELIDIVFHGGLHLPATFISVTLAQQWAEQQNRWSRDWTTAREGDAVVIGGPGEHIEYVRGDATATGVPVQGGNTSPGAEGSQFDGGTVALKERHPIEVYGVIRLHDLYPGGSGRPRQLKHRARVEPQYRHEAAGGDLHQWETGPRVEHLQQLLGIADDGYYGAGTAAAVAAFQSKHAGYGHGGATATVDLVALLERHGKPRQPSYPTLRPGAKGAIVRKLQRRLNTVTHAGLAVDGDFGYATAAAVKRLRRARRLIPVNWAVAGGRVWKVLTQ